MQLPVGYVAIVKLYGRNGATGFRSQKIYKPKSKVSSFLSCSSRQNADESLAFQITNQGRLETFQWCISSKQQTKLSTNGQGEFAT